MKFWIKVTVLERNGRFLISSLVATHSINTNRKSTTRFSMSPRWTSYVVHKPPKGWLKNAKCPKFEQQAAITRKRYEIGCQLLLITNSKSHTGFRLVPTSMTWMTLNAVIALILCFFTEFDIFSGRIYHSGWRYTYKVRKILSPSFSLPLLAKTNALCTAVSLR